MWTFLHRTYTRCLPPEYNTTINNSHADSSPSKSDGEKEVEKEEEMLLRIIQRLLLKYPTRFSKKLLPTRKKSSVLPYTTIANTNSNNSMYKDSSVYGNNNSMFGIESQLSLSASDGDSIHPYNTNTTTTYNSSSVEHPSSPTTYTNGGGSGHNYEGSLGPEDSLALSSVDITTVVEGKGQNYDPFIDSLPATPGLITSQLGPLKQTTINRLSGTGNSLVNTNSIDASSSVSVQTQHTAALYSSGNPPSSLDKAYYLSSPPSTLPLSTKINMHKKGHYPNKLVKGHNYDLSFRGDRSEKSEDIYDSSTYLSPLEAEEAMRAIMGLTRRPADTTSLSASSTRVKSPPTKRVSGMGHSIHDISDILSVSSASLRPVVREPPVPRLAPLKGRHLRRREGATSG